MNASDVARCKRCGLSMNWAITVLDNQRICNFCRYYDSVEQELQDYDRWTQLFHDHLDLYKGKYEYDAVVGYSGGKDSTYIIYTMMKEGYRVLGVTVELGFMPTSTAKENIHAIVEELGVDHIYYKIPDDEIRIGFGNAVRSAQLCELCTLFCWAIPRKIAMERKIPFIITGSDRGQMLRELSPETGPTSRARSIKLMLTPYSDEKTKTAEPLNTIPRWRKLLSRLGFSQETAEEVLPIPQKLPGVDAYPLGLQFFLFHPYNEKHIKRTISENLKWQSPVEKDLHAHFDCALHNAALYFCRESIGQTLTSAEVCVDVREGEIERWEALNTIKDENQFLDELQAPYAVFDEYFSIPTEDVQRASKKFQRRVNTYRSIRRFVLRFRKPTLELFDD